MYYEASTTVSSEASGSLVSGGGISNKLSPSPRLDWMLSATILYSVMFVFITLSFKDFFYFPLDARSGDIMPLLLVLYLVGWPMAVVIPPLLVWRRNLENGFWGRWSSVFFLIGVLLWPAVVLSIKIRSLAVFGAVAVDYWGAYPIFIFLELIWPIANVLVWTIQVRRQNPENQIKREMRERAREEIRQRLAANSRGA